MPIGALPSTMGAMDEIFTSYTANGDLHHAYLIEGDVAASKATLYAHLQNAELPHEGHPDFWAGEFEVLGIDESRALKEVQMGGPVAGAHRVFVVMTTLITHEAQNALLKVFEDPTPGSHFFLLTPSAYALLPTLRSRMMRAGGSVSEDAVSPEAEAFLNAPLKGRLDLAKKIADKKDRAYAIMLADELTRILHARFLSAGAMPQPEGVRALEAASLVRGYLNDRAPALKMLFEYLALVL